jgi:glycosyltransferase involved in cell wall biosynthesis
MVIQKNILKIMKIALICHQFPLYQGGSHIQDFILSLAKNPKVKKITLIAKHHPKVSINLPKKIKVIFIPSINIPILDDLSFILFSFFAMLFSSDFRKSDLVNVICARGIPSSFLFSKIFKKPLVATIEILNDPKNDPSLSSKISFLLQKFYYSKIKYKKIICWSEFYYKNYLKHWGIPKKSVIFIPNGINLSQYNPNIDGTLIKKKYAPDKPLIVFAKPLYGYNFLSVKLLLSVFKKFKDQNYPIHLLLGKGEYLNQTKQIIKELKLQKMVSFMPFVPMTEIPKYIAASDIIVLPYLYNPTVSRSLLEAMSTGKAIITSNLGEIPYVLTHNQDSILIKPTVNNLVKNISFLLNNKNITQKLGKNARLKCQKLYSFDKIAQDTINLYEEIK